MEGLILVAFELLCAQSHIAQLEYVLVYLDIVPVEVGPVPA